MNFIDMKKVNKSFISISFVFFIGVSDLLAQTDYSINGYNVTSTWYIVNNNMAALGVNGNKDLTLATNGHPRLTVKGSGNIGIGTASPSAKLEVNGGIKITGGGNYGDAFLNLKSSNEQGDLTWSRINAFGELAISANDGLNGLSNTAHMLINNDGNVGIGTISPSAKLEVNGGIKIGNSTITNAGTIRYSDDGFQGYNGTNWVSLDSQPQASEWVPSGSNVSYSGSGNVGIGTISPSAKLEVNGGVKITGGGYNSDPILNLTSSSNQSNSTWSRINAFGQLAISANNQLSGSTNNNPHILIKTSGNVGIGTNSPAAKLEVNGGIKIGNSTITNAGTIRYGDDGFQGYNGINWVSLDSQPQASEWALSGSNVSYSGSGNVGIGTNSPAAKLEVNGGVKITGGGNNGDAFLNLKSSNEQGDLTWSRINAFGELAISANDGLNGSTNIAHMLINNDGNVGIGNVNPTEKLDIKGGNLRIWSGDRDQYDLKIGARVHGGFGDFGIRVQNGNLHLDVNNYIRFWTNNEERLTISNSGNVGIGTASPSAKLDVDGPVLLGGGTDREVSQGSAVTVSGAVHIGSPEDTPKVLDFSDHAHRFLLWVEEGIVTEDFALADVTDWPDHVFEKDYELASLEEVENYIKANGHLPEVPAGATLKKEGYSLKDMNVVFMKKIEELTLYAIEQEKQIKAQEKEMQAMKKQLSEYEKLAHEVEQLKKLVSSIKK